MTKSIKSIEKMAYDMRKRALELSMITDGNSHFGGGLSIIDIMAVLYGSVMNYDSKNPSWNLRDRFILSKGHGVLGYYTALEQAGFISKEQLNTFQQDESDFGSHPVMKLDLGIEASNGSLGHGLGLGIGSLLAARRKKLDYKVYVLMGNGECNEGSIWEGAMAANQYKLKNLVAIIDYNELQSDGNSNNIMSMAGFEEKWSAFGWNVDVVDGHNIEDLQQVFDKEYDNEKPRVIIAKTIKGCGVNFMENDNEWHHNKMSDSQYELALQSLGEMYDGI